MKPLKKILFIIGTRPETIKLAPVIHVVREKSNIYKPVLCITSQHKEMVRPLLKRFGLKVDLDLDVMQKNQELSKLTSRIISRLTAAVEKVSPDWIVVQGDTTTVFAAALVGFYKKIKVAHVEAGLRTNDKFNPFPEEVNRKLAGVLADVHFAPTKSALKNLSNENIALKDIILTGNTVIDALFYVLDNVSTPKVVSELLRKIGDRKIILVTAHRRESFGKPFENICLALKKLAKHNQNVAIVYPVHMNPNVREPVFRELKGIPNVFLIEPLEYFSFVHLMRESFLILTDSGGIQEEAPSLGKPVFVLREKTERPEAVKAGMVRLVGTNVRNILNNVQRAIIDDALYRKMQGKKNPYGDGRASMRILRELEKRS